MGILGFQKWLVDTFPSAVVVVPSTVRDSYAHVTFDMNQLCHMAARRAADMDTLARLIFREIDATLRVCNPTKSIFFAFDGPAPLAKLLTQRKRRAKETEKGPRFIAKRKSSARVDARSTQNPHDDIELLENGSVNSRRNVSNSAKASSASVPAAPVLAIDRVALTPGTQLMHEIASAVEYYAYVRLQNNPRFHNLDIRISGPDVPGEGELKIFDWLNSFVAARAPSIPFSDSVAVVGSDADIVLQALAAVNVQNVFIFIRNSKGAGIHAKRTNTVISVWEINRQLHISFPQDSLAVRLDFIVVSIMNGNDYIPKLRGASMSRLWRRYLTLRLGRRRPTVPTATSSSSTVDISDQESNNAVSPAGDILFAEETLIDPVARTFNWPFLCALVRESASPVPEITSRTIVESKINAARSRDLQRLTREQSEGEAVELEAEQHKYDTSFDGIENCIEDDEENDDGIEGDDDDNDEDDDLEEEVTMDDFEVEASEFGFDVNGEANDLGDENLDEYEDPDTAHIENLVAITGTTTKYFDTEQWLRTLLYTLQMYIDGYCSDYYYAYTKPYAPSAKAITMYIESHDGDPHPNIHAPVSAEPALSPVKTVFAMLPRNAAHYLPLPLQEILQDREQASKIFLPGHNVCVRELHIAVDRIAPSAFTIEERQRGCFGKVLLLRVPGKHDSVPRSNPPVVPPSQRFPAINPHQVLIRRYVDSTSVPPCIGWPNGAMTNMLNRVYKLGHGRGTAHMSTRGRGSNFARGRRGNSHAFATSTSSGISGDGNQMPRSGQGRGAVRRGSGFDRFRGRGSVRGASRGTSRGSSRGSARPGRADDSC